MAEWTLKTEETPEAPQQEELSTAEKEEQVLEDAGFETPKNDDGDYTLNLDNPPNIEEDAVQQVQGETEESVLRDERVEEEAPQETSFEVEKIEDGQDIQSSGETLDEATAGEVSPDQVNEGVPQQSLPEGVDKLVQFMNETGGSLEDYINLSKDVETLNPTLLVRDYFKANNPHLNDDDLTFMMQKKFGYDKDLASQDEIREKNLSFKEELFKAQKHYNTQRDNYYAELKLKQANNIPDEYKAAHEFFNQHKEAQLAQENFNKDFTEKTEKLFTNEFKGFEFKVGDSKYRFKLNDPANAAKNNLSSDPFKPFRGEDGGISDIEGVHRSLFAMQNIDKIAQHFYEQGRAEALKSSAAESKNINMGVRQDSDSVTTPSGTKFKVISGDSSNKLRIKMK